MEVVEVRVVLVDVEGVAVVVVMDVTVVEVAPQESIPGSTGPLRA